MLRAAFSAISFQHVWRSLLYKGQSPQYPKRWMNQPQIVLRFLNLYRLISLRLRAHVLGWHQVPDSPELFHSGGCSKRTRAYVGMEGTGGANKTTFLLKCWMNDFLRMLTCFQHGKVCVGINARGAMSASTPADIEVCPQYNISSNHSNLTRDWF